MENIPNAFDILPTFHNQHNSYMFFIKIYYFLFIKINYS